MKTILLTHLAFNLTALNNNTPAVVLEATNGEGSLFKLETALYGPEGNDTPDFEVVMIEVPEHVARLLTTMQAKAAYLIAKVGEIVGEDLPYSVEIVNDPEAREYQLAITPPGATGYVIDQEQAGGETRTHATFSHALNNAYALKQREQWNLITITPVNEKGAVVGDSYTYYDAVE